MDFKNLIQDKKDKTFAIIIAGLVFVLVIMTIFFIFTKIENSEHIAAISSEKEILEQELSDLSSNYDDLHASNDSINSELVHEQEKIAALLVEMKKFKNNSYYEINQYRKEVSSLKTTLRSYIVQIDSLNQLNQKLATENTEVKQQITFVRQRNDKLEKDQKDLKEVIARASALHIENFAVLSINKAGREVNLNKCYQLRADFAITKNITAQRGNKTLYLQITRPNGNVIAFSSKSTFKYQNTKQIYSARREIEYEGERLDPVSIYWPNDGSLNKGVYKADLFCDNENIGSTEFILK